LLGDLSQALHNLFQALDAVGEATSFKGINAKTGEAGDEIELALPRAAAEKNPEAGGCRLAGVFRWIDQAFPQVLDGPGHSGKPMKERGRGIALAARRDRALEALQGLVVITTSRTGTVEIVEE